MSDYRSFVQSIVSGISEASSLTASGVREVVEREDKVLLFSPHPDDECITGLLPLRMQEELGCQVVNVPMTFGSLEERQSGRAEELAAACHYLGWGNHHGRGDLASLGVEEVVEVLKRFQPKAVFFPHVEDWNSRHIEVHHTLMAALGEMGEGFSCLAVETEFWGAMDDPNVLVEGGVDQVADLVAATSLHVEEVARNPYHLSLPAWMQDNVRRGAELVGGQGNAAPAFSFGTLYRVREWTGGRLVDLFESGQVCPLGDGELERIKIWK